MLIRQVLGFISLLAVSCATIGAGDPPVNQRNPRPLSVKNIKRVTVNPERLVRINSPIMLNVVKEASKVATLAATGTAPIDILVNSPGGIIVWGEFFRESIQIAKLRGIKVRCFTTTIAASMAFSIIADCSERYALKSSKFLFHPPSVQLGRDASVNPYEAERLKEYLEEDNASTIKDILTATEMDADVFMKAYKEEKLWGAAELQKACKPGFLIIADDIIGLPNMFDLQM